MPFIKIHKMKSSKCDWPICKCVDRYLWELRLYCKYYTHKGFILEWIFQCLLSKVKSSKYDWPICGCVDRDLWELRLFCKYYTHKAFILEWIFKCHLSKSTNWILQNMTGLYNYVDVLTEIFESRGQNMLVHLTL